MKKHLFWGVALVLLVACEMSKKDDTRDFIAGTYVRYSDHEMRTEYDTIRIESISETGNNFRLIKSSLFQKKLDGRKLPWEFRKEEWAGIYDDERKILNETKKGKVLSFIPDKNILMIGTTEYKKIN